jgi:predicted transcriptional regulator of viral defense system
VNPVAQKFFGFEPVNVLGYEVVLSDREKTVIDCIDRPELAGGIGEAAYILGTASRRCDWRKIIDYLERIGSIPLIRRFGWLLDHVQADIPSIKREHLILLASRGRKTFLGPKKPLKNTIGYNLTWRLFVNVTKEELQDSAGLGFKQTAKKEK